METSLGDFKSTDRNPNSQRRCLVVLKRQTRHLNEQQHQQQTDSTSTPAASLLKHKPSKDAPRIKTKDLDLPFKRRTRSTIGKLNVVFNPSSTSSTTKSIKRSPAVTFHLLKLAIKDLNEDLAASLVADLSASMMKKKFPAEANLCFMMAMARRMEKPLLMMLDRGFPGVSVLNGPIFGVKPGVKSSLTINTSLLPTYLIMAVALGMETLTRFMIKLGASVNTAWNGMTALHVAATLAYSPPHYNILMALLEYGADPWMGVNYEQVCGLVQLQRAFGISHKHEREFLLPLLTKSQKLVAAYKRTGSDALIPTEQTTQATTKMPVSKSDPVLKNLDSPPLSQPALLTPAEITKMIDTWKESKNLLPLAFAVCTGYQPAVITLLACMGTNKPRKINSFIPFVSSSSSSVTGISRSASQSSTPNALVPNVSASQKDCVSLLVSQNLETIVYILKSGTVDLLQQDPRGATALHIAVRCANIDMVHVLLHFDNAECSLLNFKGELGWTALHEAISLKNLEIFRLLLKKGADAEIKNDFGDTPRELGSKVNIDPADVDQLWLAPLSQAQRGGNNSSTVMPGMGANEFLHNLDPNLIRLLNTASIPSFENTKKNGSGRSLTSGDLPNKSSTDRFGMKRHVTTDGSSTLDSLDDSANSGKSGRSGGLKSGIVKMLNAGGFLLRKRSSDPSRSSSSSENPSPTRSSNDSNNALASVGEQQLSTFETPNDSTVTESPTTAMPEVAVTVTSPSPEDASPPTKMNP